MCLQAVRSETRRPIWLILLTESTNCAIRCYVMSFRDPFD
jgi:hypothetical protein